MRDILFKGKLQGSNNWIKGMLGISGSDGTMLPDLINDEYVYYESICQFTGKKLCKGRKLFEEDIVFEEIEKDYGDFRIYYVCKWIDELSRYAFLSYDEILDYEDNGISNFDETLLNSYSISDAEKFHYAGNSFDNPEILENGSH